MSKNMSKNVDTGCPPQDGSKRNRKYDKLNLGGCSKLLQYIGQEGDKIAQQRFLSVRLTSAHEKSKRRRSFCELEKIRRQATFYMDWMMKRRCYEQVVETLSTPPVSLFLLLEDRYHLQRLCTSHHP